LGLDPHTLYPKVIPRAHKSFDVEKPLPNVPQQVDTPAADTISSPPAPDASAPGPNHHHHHSMDGTLVEHHRETSIAQTDEQFGNETIHRTETSVIDEKVRISEEGDEKHRPHVHSKGRSTSFEDEEDRLDAECHDYDQLKLCKWWWILEYLPARERLHQPDGTSKKRWIWHRGRGRKIPEDQPVRVHRTVKMRMESEDLKYNPRAKWVNEPIWVE